MKRLTLVSKDSPELNDTVWFIVQAVENGNFKAFRWGYDVDYVESVFQAGGKAFISTDEGKIDGVLFFIVTENLPTYKGLSVAVEQMWYSNGNSGGSVLKAFEEYATEECDIIIMATHDQNAGSDTLKKYFLKKGYSLGETSYIKEVGPWSQH